LAGTREVFLLLAAVILEDSVGGLVSPLRIGMCREGSTWLGIKGELGFDKLDEVE
jgi:hypothetical protein